VPSASSWTAQLGVHRRFGPGRGGGGTFPLVELPLSYRASIKKLARMSARPAVHGHAFGGWTGSRARTSSTARPPPLCSARAASLRPSLPGGSGDPGADRSAKRPAPFAPAARVAGLPVDDPLSWHPRCSLPWMATSGPGRPDGIPCGVPEAGRRRLSSLHSAPSCSAASVWCSSCW